MTPHDAAMQAARLFHLELVLIFGAYPRHLLRIIKGQYSEVGFTQTSIIRLGGNVNQETSDHIQ